jgi:tight adherence protein C
MLALVALCFAAAMIFAVVTVSTTVQERASVRRSLRSIEGYRIQGVRDQEMLQSLGDRVVAPVLGGMTRLARRFTPVGYVETMRRKVVLAGNPAGFEVDRLLVLKVLGAASGILWLPLVYFLLELDGLFALILLLFLWAGAFFAPDIAIDRKIEDRQHQMARRLPDILDLLVISVEAGLGFEQAVDRTATSVPGPLSDEFRRMLQETRMGASRADALRALDERTDVQELRSFILAMLQADAFGVSIAKILRSQAEETRIRRRLAAQELAEKAPVKMLFPLIFCVFPAVFVVVLGPALITIADVFAT